MSAQNKNSELFTQDLRFNHHLSREVFPTCEFFDKHGTAFNLPGGTAGIQFKWKPLFVERKFP